MVKAKIKSLSEIAAESNSEVVLKKEELNDFLEKAFEEYEMVMNSWFKKEELSDGKLLMSVHQKQANRSEGLISRSFSISFLYDWMLTTMAKNLGVTVVELLHNIFTEYFLRCSPKDLMPLNKAQFQKILKKRIDRKSVV